MQPRCLISKALGQGHGQFVGAPILRNLITVANLSFGLVQSTPRLAGGGPSLKLLSPGCIRRHLTPCGLGQSGYASSSRSQYRRWIVSGCMLGTEAGKGASQGLGQGWGLGRERRPGAEGLLARSQLLLAVRLHQSAKGSRRLERPSLGSGMNCWTWPRAVEHLLLAAEGLLCTPSTPCRS